jgi:hypothetical protein
MMRNWMRVASDAVMLGLEAQRVIGLRLMKLSRGGRGAEAEALRMVTEKASALAEVGAFELPSHALETSLPIV